jgi:comEA protein
LYAQALFFKFFLHRKKNGVWYNTASRFYTQHAERMNNPLKSFPAYNTALLAAVIVCLAAAVLRTGVRSSAPPIEVTYTSSETPPPLLDLNQADEEELALLPGIGPVRARAIVEYRREHGDFTSVEELTRVKGLGPKTVQRIADMLRIRQ